MTRADNAHAGREEYNVLVGKVIDIDASPSAATSVCTDDDVDARISRALETFSTRLTNVKHAIGTDVHKAYTLAKHGASQVDALAEALEERFCAIEARLERLEMASLGRAFGDERDDDDDDGAHRLTPTPMRAHGGVKMLDNAAFEATARDGDAVAAGYREGKWSSPAGVVMCAKAVTSGILRVAAACALLWFIFWITVAIAVLVDDRELTRELTSSARWKSLFWDEIFTVMA